MNVSRLVEHLPLMGRSVSDHASQLGMPSRWGVIVLLFFVLLAAVFGLNAWRLQAASAPAATTQPTAHSMPKIEDRSGSLNVENTTTSEPASEPASSDSTQNSSSPQASASVNVNGQDIALPSNGNGSVHKEMTTDGSKTTVDVNVSSGGTSNSSHSSLNLNVHSSSNQSASVNNSE